MILAISLLTLAIWLHLLLFRGMFWRERPLPAPPLGPAAPAVVAVIPARDEAAGIGEAVLSLLGQRYPGRFRIVLVDDQSSDGTGEIARRAAIAADAPERLTVIRGAALPAGWTGKLWAVEQGLRHVAAEGRGEAFVLLTDADIAHDPANLAGLVARAEAGGLDLASLMVELRCRSWPERAFVPAFVFFFAMLYPFAWIADPRRRTAGAAGGCMLVRRTALERIGGMAAIRDDLIDDCALGRRIKESGGRIWLGLAAGTRSLRAYPAASDIWRMVARTAYTQLRYSPLLLLGTVLGMAATFVAPPLLLLAGLVPGSPVSPWPALIGGLAWAAMSLACLPILGVYRQPRWAAPLLPLVALFYTAATVDSARRHWQGRGGEWKGRVRAKGAA